MAYKKMQWLSEEGGYVIVERSIAPAWNGYPADDLDADPLDPSHDYGRAAEAMEDGRDIAIISIDGEEAMVVTGGWDVAWFPRNYGGILMRWIGADSEDDLLRNVDVRGKVLEKHTCQLHVPQGDLVAFDSLLAGEDGLKQCLELKLTPGVYIVRTEECRPDPHTWFIAHRFERRG